MARGRRTGDGLVELAARAEERVRARRDPDVVGVMDARLDRYNRLRPGDGDERADKAVQLGLARSPVREPLRRAFDVIEPFALHVRLSTLDPPRWSAWFRREERRCRQEYSSLVIADDALAALERTSGIALARETIQRELEHSALRVTAIRTWVAAADASGGVKGKHGHARRRRDSFRPLAAALREWDVGYWSWELIASLILRSGTGADAGVDDDWVDPPCPETVRYWADRDLLNALQQDARRA